MTAPDRDDVQRPRNPIHPPFKLNNLPQPHNFINIPPPHTHLLVRTPNTGNIFSPPDYGANYLCCGGNDTKNQAHTSLPMVWGWHRCAWLWEAPKPLGAMVDTELTCQILVPRGVFRTWYYECT